MQTPDESVLRRIVTSRFLLFLAEEQGKLERDAAAHATIHLLHDAIEMFLIACADFVHADIKQKTEFAQIFDMINAKLPSERQLTHRIRLMEINKVRGNSKHSGVTPDPRQIPKYISDGKEFLSSASSKVFGLPFESASLIYLLDEGEAKTHLETAAEAFLAGENAGALAECRKAIFVEFEQDFDVRRFESVESGKLNALAMFSSAPYYARSAEYIAENVMNPFDYIVLDHAKIDSLLTKQGIGHEVYWNIWRLTPQVYLWERDQPWMIKHEPEKTEDGDVKGRASYVLDATTEIILRKHSHKRSIRWIRSATEFIITPRPGAPLYKKADSSSDIVDRIPDDKTRVRVDFGTPGLKQDEYFWHVADYTPTDGFGVFLYGYLLDDDRVAE